MFFYYNSNSLSELITPLSEALSEYRRNNPFRKTWIVVQNKETQQWLSLELARVTGISFNIEFVLPAELTWKLYRLYDPELPVTLPSDRIPMQWTLFDILENQHGKSQAFNKGTSSKTSFQFAGQVADVFDLYQMYRPGLIRVWETGQYLTNDPSERWQAQLWNSLRSVWEKEYPELPTRADVFFKLKNWLQERDRTFEFPDSLFVFGNSHLSASFLEVLEAISISSHIHLFRNNYDFKKGSEEYTILEQDWAQPSIDGDILIEEIQARNGDKHFRAIDSTSKQDSVLSKLNSSERTIVPVIIHSCHNERREVEILKDQLLSHFDSDKSLNPEDVLIVVPDIQKYGVILESIFSGNDQEPSIPIYNPAANINRVTEDFLYLIGVLKSDVKVSEVIELLSRPSVQDRFDFREEEIFIIKDWLAQNNIHWGLTTEDSDYSLTKASHNLLSGYLMEVEEFQSLRNYIPFKGIDSSEKAELAASFSFFIRFLKKWEHEISNSRTFFRWVKTIENLYEAFSPVNPKDEYNWISLQHSLARLIEISSISHSTINADFGLFEHWLKKYLNNEQASSTRFGNGVMLSTYIPYRGIPFRRVYMLGMNEKEFPRNTIRPSFDLINKYPQQGDRISKQDDAFLFFELLSNSSEFLSISYIGQDMYTNEDRLPSVLVQKLIDVYPFIKVQRHKLHGFDSDYFKSATSFSKAQRQLAERVLDEREGTVPFVSDYNFELDKKPKVDINQLIQFFSHPSKYLLSNLFQIKAPFENEEPEDREVFKVSGLAKYDLNHLLAKALEEGNDVSSIEEYVRVAGLIPQELPGKRDFEIGAVEISKLFNLSKPFQSGEETAVDIYVESEAFEYQGKIKVTGYSKLIVKPSRFKAKDFINAWIQHLSLQTASKEFQTILIGRNEYNTQNVGYIFSEIDSAIELLEDLVKKFLLGFTSKEVHSFFPESSKKYAESSLKGNEEALYAAWKAWEGSEYINGEGTDFYNSLNWRGINPLNHPSFAENALSFWTPLIKNLQKLDR